MLGNKFSFLISETTINYNKVFKILLGFHFLLMCLGLTNLITDEHGFRQTQTALTSLYFLKEGFKLDYITPVLGAPWTIPFEFPIYQYIVAILQKITGLHLDICGRLVSILSFYLVIAIVLRLDSVIKEFPSKALACFLLCNPLYIFWTRTFLIESMALLYAIAFLYFFLCFYLKKKNSYGFLMLVFALLASLTKITTFSVAVAFVALYVAQSVWEDKASIRDKYLRITFIVLTLCTSVFAQLVWTKNCDAAKMRSYLGNSTTSKSLQTWNFGEMNARFEWENWNEIFYKSGYVVLLAFLVLIVALSYKKLFVKRPFILFLLAGLAGPLVFFNLYKVHSYYHYANTLFLLGGIALCISSLKSFKLQKIVFFAVILTNLSYYFSEYYISHRNNNNDIAISALCLKTNSHEEDVALVIGMDWGSEIPYYSERKCICIPEQFLPELENSPELFIEKLKTKNIKHVLLRNHRMSEIDKPYFQKLKTILDLKTERMDDKGKGILISNN